jgi:hypothetical protein
MQSANSGHATYLLDLDLEHVFDLGKPTGFVNIQIVNDAQMLCISSSGQLIHAIVSGHWRRFKEAFELKGGTV